VDCTSGIERYVWAGDNIVWELRGPGANTETADRLELEYAVGQEYGIVGYTHAGGVDRPLVAYKTLGGNAGAVVVPHMNWRGLFSMGTAPSGATSPTPVEWPGFRTTANHSMGETQAITKNWMGSLLEGQRDAGGQMYMRNRYYDPATGQFTQTDPIGIAGGLNTYGFAAGDPISYSDPYGLDPIVLADPNPAIRARMQAMFSTAWHNSPTFRRAARAMIQDSRVHHRIVSSASGLGDCYAQSCTVSKALEEGRGKSQTTIAGIGSGAILGSDDFESFVHEFVHAAALHGARNSFERRSGIPARCMRQEEEDNDGSCVENYEARILGEIEASQRQKRASQTSGAGTQQ
jgi:RHS repeat-associated protein